MEIDRASNVTGVFPFRRSGVTETWLGKTTQFEWTWFFFKEVIADFWLFACCISFGFAIFLWINIINKYPFSQAYPLTSFSFVFGLYASWLIFGETIPYSRWIGMALVIAGCFLIMK